MDFFSHPDFGRAVIDGGRGIVLSPERIGKANAAPKKRAPASTLKPRAGEAGEAHAEPETGNGSPRSGSPRKRGTAARFAGAARRILLIALKSVIIAHAVFIGTTSLLIALYARMDPGVTVLMARRRFADGYDVKPMVPMRLDELSLRRRNMLVRIEDWNFENHRGFDLPAIKNAWLLNKKVKRPMYGGSTLSMQTARSLFLVPAKSYFRKYLEAIVTVELELILPKDRILELYLDCAEWGKGIFGLKAASAAYFKAKPSAIDDDQYARLVTILSSPVIHGPYDFGKARILYNRYAILRARYFDPAPEAPSAGDAAEAAEAAPGAADGAAPAQGGAEKAESGAAAPEPSFTPAPNG